MNTVYYRSVTLADAEDLWRVRTSAIVALCSEHYCHETIRAWASTPMHAGFLSLIREEASFVVAQVDQRVAGYGFMDVPQASVNGVFVHPKHARRGIGKTLLSKLELHARSTHLEQLTLDSTLNAVPFYTAQGYRQLSSGMWSHPARFELACVHMAKVL